VTLSALGREDGNRDNPRRRGRALVGLLETADQAPRDRQHRARVGFRHALERRLREPHERAVPHGANGRRSRIAGQHRHLADDLTPRDVVEHGWRPVRRFEDGLQTPADQEVQRVADVTLAEQRLAAVEADPPDFGFDRAAGGVVQAGEQAARAVASSTAASAEPGSDMARARFGDAAFERAAGVRVPAGLALKSCRSWSAAALPRGE